MKFGELIAIVAASLVVLFFGYRLARHYFSDEVKLERRRRRSHSPIINRSNKPSVKLSVRTEKDRKK